MNTNTFRYRVLVCSFTMVALLHLFVIVDSFGERFLPSAPFKGSVVTSAIRRRARPVVKKKLQRRRARPKVHVETPQTIAPVTPPLPAAVDTLRDRALHGDVQAQVELGVAYFDGRDVEQNLVHAYAWVIVAQRNGRSVGEILHAIGYIMTAEQIAESLQLADTLQAEIQTR